MNKILTLILKYIPLDKIMHGGVGFAIVPLTALVYWVSVTFGVQWGIDLAGVLLGGGKEAQDKVLKNGTPDPWDAVATAGACAVLSHTLAFFGMLPGLQ